MKLVDRFLEDDDKVVHHRVFDAEPSIKRAKEIRDQGFDKKTPTMLSDSYLVASIPMWLVTKIIKDAGLTWDDPASKDAVMRALQSGEYDKFRVWGGKV